MRIAPILFTVAVAATAVEVHAQQAAAPAASQPQAGSAAAVIAKDVIWGIKGGIAGGGTAWYDDEIEIEIDGGYALTGFVDYRLGPKLFGTLALHIVPLSGDADVEALKDLSLLLKAAVGGGPNAQFLFRPGFGFGYGSDGDAKYLMMHTFVEMVPIRASKPWVFDLGMFFAPVGGSDEYDMTLEPRITLRFGRLF
jgi:hypothetical protein